MGEIVHLRACDAQLPAASASLAPGDPHQQLMQPRQRRLLLRATGSQPRDPLSRLRIHPVLGAGRSPGRRVS